MEIIKIEGTEDTPLIILDNINNVFRIIGTSTPENVIEFYAPVVDWINKIENTLSGELICEFYFKYLSSSSHKIIYDILNKLEILAKKGHEITILWKFLIIDEDMQEVGEDFSELVNLPFQFVSIDV
ncbi:MAG: DUF1987 domain-containing protein [Bacteroidales bacterium]|nr:DUF1987 domain-containing protein [Bacteroidales bacterium]